MLDLKEERRVETGIIQKINEDLEKILKSDDFIKGYSLNQSNEAKGNRSTDKLHNTVLDSSTTSYNIDTDIIKRMDSDDDSFDNSEAGSLISKSGVLTESKMSSKKKKNVNKKIAKSLKGSVIKK